MAPIGDQAVNAINLYREIYGVDYPFAKMDLVADPMGSFYGQAPPSIVYLGYGVFYPTARVNLNSRGDISSFQNTVVSHELGHQWWGSAIVNKNFGNYWFVETLAEYSSALYSENVARSEAGEKDPAKAAQKGWNAYMKDVGEWRRMLMDRPNLFTSVQHSDQMMPGVEPAARMAAIYNKGPYAFHMLRLLFGDGHPEDRRDFPVRLRRPGQSLLVRSRVVLRPVDPRGRDARVRLQLHLPRGRGRHLDRRGRYQAAGGHGRREAGDARPDLPRPDLDHGRRQAGRRVQRPRRDQRRGHSVRLQGSGRAARRRAQQERRHARARRAGQPRILGPADPPVSIR
ncbi:MAG: hypothetical protein JRF63_13795 [Deltaproteobacteria bacterium]|nr:hypothetical protein [Deltaproteobacteria bacterium]